MRVLDILFAGVVLTQGVFAQREFLERIPSCAVRSLCHSLWYKFNLFGRPNVCSRHYQNLHAPHRTLAASALM